MINSYNFRALRAPEDAPKIARVLHRLCCGESFNRFEAETKLHDHALNSTISALVNGHHVDVVSIWETVPGYRGKETACKRYSINANPENLTRCYWLLRTTWGFTRSSSLPDPQPPKAA